MVRRERTKPRLSISLFCLRLSRLILRERDRWAPEQDCYRICLPGYSSARWFPPFFIISVRSAPPFDMYDIARTSRTCSLLSLEAFARLFRKQQPYTPAVSYPIVCAPDRMQIPPGLISFTISYMQYLAFTSEFALVLIYLRLKHDVGATLLRGRRVQKTAIGLYLV